jgi:predicted TIM-barrel fold metal-dependent hydrolase
VGWLVGLLEAFDWQWRNSGVIDEHPEYDLLPSEYFMRQIYGCFWFEKEGARRALELFPDNILYETDFPHPTCMAPGPRTPGQHPRAYAQDVLGDLPDDVLSKVLHDNAAALYGLD